MTGCFPNLAPYLWGSHEILFPCESPSWLILEVKTLLSITILFAGPWPLASQQSEPVPALGSVILFQLDRPYDVAALSRLSALLIALKFQPRRLMAWLFQPIFSNQDG